MIGLIARFLLLLAALLTGLFVSQDALNFSVYQFIVAVSIVTLITFIIAFWPYIKNWFKK